MLYQGWTWARSWAPETGERPREGRRRVSLPRRLPARTTSSDTTGPDIALDVVDSRADSKGVTIQVYRPAGRPQYASRSE